jgi:hypothetical protein
MSVHTATEASPLAWVLDVEAGQPVEGWTHPISEREEAEHLARIDSIIAAQSAAYARLPQLFAG